MLSILSGQDGEPNAIYQIQYEDDDEMYEVDDLTKDFTEGNLKFADI